MLARGLSSNHMSDNEQRQEAATSPGQPRPAAANPDNEFSLSIDEVIERYAGAGLPRDKRTIQRYCAAGKLDCHKIEIPYGDRYMVTPTSVERHIAYIKEVRQAVASHGEPRSAMADAALKNKDTAAMLIAATTTDEPRQAPTAASMSQPVAANTRVVELLERENEFLRGQVAVKDTQIAELQERAHETNTLINGLQRLLAPLLSSPERDPREWTE